MPNAIKKGINIWSFHPSLSIPECMRMAKDAGFDGIELAVSLDGPLNMDNTDGELLAMRRAADDADIEINGVVSGLYFQFSMTSSRADIREKTKSLIRRQLHVAAVMGVRCILVCPGAVGVDFSPDAAVPDAGEVQYFAGSEVIDYDVAYERALEVMREMAVYAEETGVEIGIENIWNKFLLSPLEMRGFIDDIGSPMVGAYVDVGNMMPYGYPEHWIKILNSRVKMVHFKDYRRQAHGLAGFVDLLSGDVDWIKVVDGLTDIGYEGWATAEMTPVYAHYSDQIIYNTSAAMDRILRRPKA